MKSKTQFNKRQLLTLGTIMMLAPALRLFPGQAIRLAGRANWLSGFAAMPLLLFYLYFISRFIGCRRDGENLQELILRGLGPTLGKIALALMSAWLLLYAGFVLRSGSDRLIVTIYPNSAPPPFSVTMGLLALIAALRDPRSLVRFARMVRPVLMIVLLLIFIFSLFSIDFGNLLPVTVDDVLPVFTGSLVATDIIAAMAFAMCLIVGEADRSSHKFSSLSVWALGGCLLLTLLSVVITGIFGVELTARLSLPFFTLVRNLVFFNTVERVEALVVILWIFPDFLLVSLYLWAAQHSIRLILGYDPVYRGERITDFSKGRWVIWLSGTAAILCALFLGSDSRSLNFWSVYIIPISNIGISFVFLPLVYAVGKAKKNY